MWLPEWLRLAHKTTYLQQAQEINGIAFDIEKAKKLLVHINEEMTKIEEEVLPQLPPRPLKKSEMPQFTMPKKPFRLDGSYSELMCRFAAKHGGTLDPDNTMTLSGETVRVAGGAMLDVKLPMSLSNQDDLKDWFLESGWVPSLYNFKKDANGKVVRDSNKQPIQTSPKLQENGRLCPNLEQLDGGLAKLVVRYLSYRNRRSVLEGWLDSPRLPFDGRLTAGSSGITNTFRQKHTIVANVPKNKEHVLLGKEFRELFIARRGLRLVGFDASSLEDRIKGHLTYKYDGGEYANKILSPGYDPHQENADLWTIDRSIAKNGTYALGYFCGVKKLATTIKCSQDQAAERHKAYWELNAALKALDEALERHWESNGKKYIIGLDGRRVYSRHRHGLVNLAIQSSGSILMDCAAVWMDTKLGGLHYDGTGAFYLVDGKRAYRVLYMHDEYVYDCEEAIAQYVADVGSESIKRAGERFNLRVPLLSEAKIGLNWSELK